MTSKITDIQLQKKNKNRVNIYLDNEYAFSCDAELVYKFRLKSGTEVNADSLNEIVENDNFAKAKNDALRLIERSYKTEGELRDKLTERGYSKNIIDKAIDFMMEYGFIDDKKYVEMYVNDRIKNRGRNKIKYDLLKKGVDEETINDKIDNVSSEDEFSTAYELCSKKYSILIKRESDERKIKQKLLQFLVSRGYSWETSKSVSNKLLKVETFED